MIAYKVFRVGEGGLLESCVVSGKAKVLYPRNCKIIPPKWLSDLGYGLTCFLDFELAERFVRTELSSSDAVVIKKVTVDGSKVEHNLPHKSDCQPLSEGKLKTYPGSSCYWPMGTVMVPWVRITKE